MRPMFALAAATLALGACLAEPQAAPAEALGAPAPAVVRVPLGFDFPAALAAVPDGSVLVGDLATGEVFRVTAALRVEGPLTDLPSTEPTGEWGLLGLAAHPDWPTQPWVYAFYTEEPSVGALGLGLRFSRIVRFELPPGAAQAGPAEDVVTGLTTSNVCCHNGGRIAFGPDGMLYATVGDNMVSPVAQVPFVVAGKVLRYTPEGGIPADNPFPGFPAAVTGLRNTFGLTFDSEFGMIVTDNGPSGFDGVEGADEVNILRVGDNAGWPVSRGAICLPVHVCPVWQSGNAHLGPTGVVVPRDSRVPAWDGQVLFCAVNDARARLLDPTAANPEPVVVAGDGCRYDVVQAADGRIVMAGDGELWVHG